MTDPFDAAKRDLEEQDRVKSLAGHAKARLRLLDRNWRKWPKEQIMDELLDTMTWGEAMTALEYIEAEENGR